jgi:L-fucose isomerase-like protein
MNTKIKIVFTAKPQGVPGWPHINYNYNKKKNEILSKLQKQYPDFEFSAGIFTSLQEAETALDKDNENYDGYLVFTTTNWTRIPEYIARNFHPVIVADISFHGSGCFLRTNSIIIKEKLPVVTVSSSNIQDAIEKVKLFRVIKQLKKSKVVLLADSKDWNCSSDGINTMSSNEKVEKARELFGVEFIKVGFEELKKYYDEAEEKQNKEAKEIHEKWKTEADEIVEPSEEEISRSAKLYLALKKISEDYGASAVTVDCLALHKENVLFKDFSAYPCMAYFQLNNDGQVGVCEADIDSTISQLAVKYLTGRPAFVSDPVIDTSSGQIIYAHCVSPNRMFGKEGSENPYKIRSHNEDRSGVSVQSIMPSGKKVTTVKFSTLHKCFAIHQGISVGNLDKEQGCRTKLAVETNARQVLKNYFFEIFEWHLVTFFGDYRGDFIDLAKLSGLKVIEQDKEA